MMTFKDDWHSGRFVNCIYLYLMGGYSFLIFFLKLQAILEQLNSPYTLFHSHTLKFRSL